MLTLLLDVKDSLGNYYRTVAWNEVIHIYSGMETRVEKNFNLDELNSFITVGGPLNVTVNGDVPDEVYVRLYRDVNYEDNVGFAYSTTNTWQTSIPVVLTAPVVFYLIVEARYEGISFLDKCGSVTVNNDDITDHAINVTFSGTETITLSGTADVKINNVAAKEVWIAAYLASDIEIRRIQVLPDDSWQMLLPLRHIGATVSFHVIAIDRGKGYDLSKDTGISRTLSAQNTGIDIVENFTTIKISGKANITVNGNPPSYASIEIYRRQNTVWAASCVVDLTDFSWEISLPVDLVGNNLYIRIEGNDYNEKWFSYLFTPVSSPFVLPSSDTVIPPFTNAITTN